MSEPKFTPGPWGLSRYHYPYRDIVQRTGDQDNDARPGERRICTVSTKDKAEQEANAHLIAAAPELYGALEGAREWLDGWASAEPYITIINNALANARGESND